MSIKVRIPSLKHDITINRLTTDEMDDFPIIEFSAEFESEEEMNSVIADLEYISDYARIVSVLDLCVKDFTPKISDELVALEPCKAVDTLFEIYKYCVMVNPSIDIMTNEIQSERKPFPEDLEKAIDLLPDNISSAIKRHLYRDSFIDSIQLMDSEDDDPIAFEVSIDDVLSDIHELSFDIAKVRGLIPELESKIIGQRHAADHVYAIVRRLAVGFRDVNKPPAVLLFAGPTGVGKAVALDTKIPTPSGFSIMRDIKIGDEVYDESGKICVVTYVSPVFNDKECYKVVFDTKETIIASEDHLWNVITNNKKEQIRNKKNGYTTVDDWREYWDYSETLSTKELLDIVEKSYGRKNLIIPCSKPIDGIKYNGVVEPYLFGYWLGDGSSYDSSITIGQEDYDDVLKILQSKTSRDISVRDSTINESCSAFNLSMLKSDIISSRLCSEYDNSTKVIKRIPNIILRADMHTKLEVLRGLMDSDGYIVNKNCVGISMTNYDLLIDIKELIVSMGYKVRYSEKTIKYNNQNKIVYMINFRPDVNVFELNRKKNKIDLSVTQKSRHTSRTILSIEKIDKVECKCITVDSPRNLYLVGDGFIPTHNTLMAKVTTEYLFGSSNKFGRIDCATLSEKHDISKLIGAPPGYVGYPSDRGGDPKEQDPAVIFREVSKMGPNGGVLLLDEVEKAHPDIWDIFLTAFDEGYVKTSVGNVVDLRNVIIIMTTNLGSKEFDDMQRKNPIGFYGVHSNDICGEDDTETIKTIKKTATDALRDYMKPEMIGRITDVVPFMNLNKIELKAVAGLEWCKAKIYLVEKIKDVNLTEELKDHIASSASDKKLGARPVQRMIEQYAVDAVAEIYVEHPEIVMDATNIIIDIADNNGKCDMVSVLIGEDKYDYEIKQTLSEE
jgi:hypothetical protein